MTKSFLVGLFLTSLFLMGCGANRDSSSQIVRGEWKSVILE
jgi:hypothetical protein